MNNVDTEYFRLINLVLNKGRVKKNRTGIDTIGVFGAQARFDLSDTFPILTTKKVFLKGIIHELLWFIKGDTNIKYLVDNDVHIWDEWAYKRYDYHMATDPTPNGGEDWSLSEFIDRIKKDSEFATRWGQLGEGTYGSMWRNFPANINMIGYKDRGDGKGEFNGVEVETVDQLSKVLFTLKKNPDDRRMIVSAWHPYWVDHCALPPCHCLFQFHTEELTIDERSATMSDEDRNMASSVAVDAYDKEGTFVQEMDRLFVPKRRLNCQLYQRSVDTFLGLPFNLSSYSLLTCMMAHCVNMIPGSFIHTSGDLHIYLNHIDQCKLQLSREPMELPKLWLNPEQRDLFKFTYDDIKLIDYKSHPAIKGDVAV